MRYEVYCNDCFEYISEEKDILKCTKCGEYLCEDCYENQDGVCEYCMKQRVISS